MLKIKKIVLKEPDSLYYMSSLMEKVEFFQFYLFFKLDIGLMTYGPNASGKSYSLFGKSNGEEGIIL